MSRLSSPTVEQNEPRKAKDCGRPCSPAWTGGQLVKHARYCWLVLAEGYLTRQRFGSMLKKDCGAAGQYHLLLSVNWTSK